MKEWEFQLLEDKAPVESVCVGGIAVKKGDRVRLRPRKGGDVFDLALAGQTAAIESIEQDYEGKLHLAVVLEDDPGKDLGMLRQPGHRFFFTAEEVELLSSSDQKTIGLPRILVAGIGNIFLGDDAFGVEVVRRLSTQEFPERVRIRDFGIRGYDLAYALLDGYDLAILVDACPRGEAPGTLYVIEPDLGEADDSGSSPVALDAHTMNPVSVIRMAQTLGPVSKRILLIGCEPATLGGEEGRMELSEVVCAAVDEAVKLVRKLVADAQADDPVRKPS
ncbi:MAG: hydrogenase maturation protease [Bryobacteraceae bacterium]